MSFAIVTFKWQGSKGYRSKFSAHQVNVLRNMFERHLHMPHDFVCVTDDAEGLDPRIRTVPLWPDLGEMLSPHGPHEPSCYRRLRLFARDAGELLGVDRFAWCDLDVVLTKDVTHIFNRPEPIVLLPNPYNAKVPYNGSLVMMDAGARPEVWETFDPASSPKRNVEAKCAGSDQGQISYCLKGKNEATWKVGPDGDGVYFFHRIVHEVEQPDRFMPRILPEDCCFVSFHGHGDPWSSRYADLGWVRKHYQ